MRQRASIRTTWRHVTEVRTASELRQQARAAGFELPVDEEVVTPDGPLFEPIEVCGKELTQRLAFLPIEGADGDSVGRATPETVDRWTRIGRGGAHLHWGCEAIAVRADGRSNPRQLVLDDTTVASIARARTELSRATRTDHGVDPVVGAQLTHSGRYSRPTDAGPAPRTARISAALDPLVGANAEHVMSDEELDELVGVYVQAACLAQDAGFDFVDIKHCHGYLLHELLGPGDRNGRYGGPLSNRMRFLRLVVEKTRRQRPDLAIGVRLSAFDFAPFVDCAQCGQPSAAFVPGTAFGATEAGLEPDLREPSRFLDELIRLGIDLVCLTAGSPYYNVHIQRPTMYPDPAGYDPPEDPLAGVARQIQTVAQLKARHPGLILVGSGYSYLQPWLAHVAQAAVRLKMTDFAGLGRMAMAYPNFPADARAGRPYQPPASFRL